MIIPALAKAFSERRVEDESRLKKAGWRHDGASWKRGRHAAMRDGFGWMIYRGTECVWNNDTLPGWATAKKPGRMS